MHRYKTRKESLLFFNYIFIKFLYKIVAKKTSDSISKLHGLETIGRLGSFIFRFIFLESVVSCNSEQRSFLFATRYTSQEYSGCNCVLSALSLQRGLYDSSLFLRVYSSPLSYQLNNKKEGRGARIKFGRSAPRPLFGFDRCVNGLTTA